MTTLGTLIHGGWLVRNWTSDAIPDGAVYELNGRIAAVGSYGDLAARYPKAKHVGDSSSIVAPGFVNAHSHGRGLTTLQMGIVDEPLEVRLIDISTRSDRLPSNRVAGGANSTPDPDPYLDTFYSCLKQIASGITTTLHSSTYVEGPVAPYCAATHRFVQAYRDSGIRCAYTLGIRDLSALPFAKDEEFIASLPPEARHSRELTETGNFMSFAEYHDLLKELAATYPDVRFQFGPWNPVFCSDGLLEAIAEASRSEGWRIQTHLVETQYQAASAYKRYGTSWARHLADIGMLSPRFSGAHCVWFDGDDIALAKQSQAQVVHNPGSNLRLSSGIAPVPQFLAADVPVAFGIDSLGMNDDEDMFQDLRLSRLIHGTPRIDSKLIPAKTMLDMATRRGADVTGFADIGCLDEGNWADVILLSKPEIEGAPSELSIADLVLTRGKPAHVKMVMIGGKIHIDHGQWLDQSPIDILRDLSGSKMLSGSTSKAGKQLKEALINFLR
jgi:cytosine/adenosine deaminase-related metal-dependent hydrolase